MTRLRFDSRYPLMLAALALFVSGAGNADAQQLALDPSSFAASYAAGDTIDVKWSGGDPAWTVDLDLVDVAAWQVLSAGAIAQTANDGQESFHLVPQLPDGVYQIYLQESNQLQWSYGPQFTVGGVSTCEPPPAGMTFWAQFDTALGPDDVAGMTAAQTLGAGRTLVASDIPGHSGAFLRRSGTNSQLVYARQGASQTPWGFRRGDFSIDAWVRIPVANMASASYGTIGFVDTRNAGAANVNGVTFFASQGNLAFAMGTNFAAGEYRAWVSTANIADGNWHHVAVTVQRDSAQGGTFYVDGVPVSVGWLDPGTRVVETVAADAHFDPRPVSGQLGIANTMAVGVDRGHMEAGAGGQEEPGFDIDEIEAFNRVLTATEIATLYQLPKCR